MCELDSHVELCICFQPYKNMNAKEMKKENMETQNREATNMYRVENKHQLKSEINREKNKKLSFQLFSFPELWILNSDF